jgi:hypothetical protein
MKDIGCINLEGVHAKIQNMLELVNTNVHLMLQRVMTYQRPA